MTKRMFLEKAHNIHGYKYKYIDLNDEIIPNDYIKFTFDDQLFEQRVVKHLIGREPDKTKHKKTTEEFIIESKKIWNKTYDYSLTEYIGANKKLKLIERLTGKIIEQIPTLHLQGRKPNIIKHDTFIELSKIVSNYKYSYEKCNYINKTTKVILNCPDHGDFIIHPFNHLNYAEVCPRCEKTLGSKKIISFLRRNNINFDRQKIYNDFTLAFNFHIPSINTVIEFLEKENYDKKYKFHNILEENNRKKNDYCEEKYINIIEIPYYNLHKIDDILFNNLKDILHIIK